MPARSGALALVAVAALVAVIDQLTKAALVSAIDSGQIEPRTDILGGWLALEYAENRGAAFGILSGLTPLLTTTSVVIVCGLVLLYLRQVQPSHWQTLATGAITGGAVGNLVDRFRLGYVIDFVSVGVWPNFNVADSAITLGVLVILWGATRPATAFGMAPIGEQKSR